MSNQEGARCPYDERAPHTLEGWEVWELLHYGGSELRVADSGTVIGLNIPALLTLAEARDFDREVAARLLSYAEAGVMAASNRARID